MSSSPDLAVAMPRVGAEPPTLTADPLIRLLGGPVLGLALVIPVLPRAGFSLAHVLMIALLPVTAVLVTRVPLARILAGCCLLWLASASLAEVMGGGSLRDAAYALSQPVLLFVTFITYLWLFRFGRDQMLRSTAWLVFGLLAAAAVRHSPAQGEDPWKYLFGALITSAVVLAVAATWSAGRRSWGVFAIAAIATVSVVLGSRSLALMALVALAVGLFASRRVGSSGRMLLGVAATATFVVLVVVPVYGHFAAAGTFGVEQQYKWTAQSRVTGGVLLGARPEVAASPIIISESPILGRGVGFQPGQQTQDRFINRLKELGVPVQAVTSTFYFSQGTYLHSAIFQFWADAGIGAVPALIFPLVVSVRALALAFRSGSADAVLAFAFLTVSLGVLLVFSPWDRMEATLIGATVAGAVAYLTAARSSEQERIPAQTS